MSLYNRVVFRIAAKKSFLHISWLVALIGIPIVFFSDGLSLLGKGLLWTGLLVIFWLLYLALCIFFHRLGLRDVNNRAAYLAKNDIEKGEEVGSKLESW